MKPTTKKLTAAQIHALSMIALSSKGFLWTGDGIGLGANRKARAVEKATAKALERLGLVAFHSASGWRSQGIGVWACYKATPEGKALILIGRMLHKLHG